MFYSCLGSNDDTPTAPGIFTQLKKNCLKNGTAIRHVSDIVHTIQKIKPAKTCHNGKYFHKFGEFGSFFFLPTPGGDKENI
jgi:hypothetical protein